jgi:hypothetical protein
VRAAASVFELCERFGATRCRLFEMGAAGEMTGTHIAVIEHDDMRGHGRMTEALTSDREGQKLRETVRGEKAPVELMSSGIYREIPILNPDAHL